MTNDNEINFFECTNIISLLVGVVNVGYDDDVRVMGKLVALI